MADGGGIPEGELRQRVLYSLLTPAVKLARAFGMPLKELLSWVETAYFHELRSRDHTLKEVSARLGVSQRTTVRLSKQLRESFFRPELDHNLPRRIEFMLWAQPMSEARLQQVLPEVEPEQVSAAIQTLLDGGRIEENHGRTLTYEARANVRRLPRDTWMARIGALNSLTENLANAAFGRFFRGEPKAFARTLSFQVPKGRLEALEELYEQVILPALSDLSEEAEPDGDNEDVQVTLLWAPYEYMEDVEPEE